MRLRRLSREYSGRVIRARRGLGYARISAGWSDERWLAECRDIDREIVNRIGSNVAAPFTEVAGERIAYWKPICSKYERAACYPWLPVEPDPPKPE